MLKISENPPSRFPQRPICKTSDQWWLAKVKPRQEKALAFDMMKNEIEYYLPLYCKVTRRKDNNKPRKSIICLFPGYISFNISCGAERTVFKTNRIVNILQINNQKRFVRELDQIYHTLDLGMPLEPLSTEEQLIQGTPVSVEYGPLRGISGTIIKVKNSQKLVLSVDGLGNAAVTIDAHYVKSF